MLNAPHVLLQKYFKSDPCYLHLLDDFMFAARSAATGRLLQFEAHPVQAHGLETYTYKTYRVRKSISAPISHKLLFYKKIDF